MNFDAYMDLNKKSPQEAADIVGKVSRRNYLAHTIRDIELAILLTQKIHYHIIKLASETNRLSKIYFCEQGCEIWLASDEIVTDERKIRLILAHELGHLIHNIDKLKDTDHLNKICNRVKQGGINKDEEIYAWDFAFFLIFKKSLEHQNDIKNQKGKFVYKPGELKKSIVDILRESNPEILDDVMTSLN